MPEKLDKVPPDTVTSDITKFVDDSLKVKVNVAVSPVIKLLLLELKEIVGITVSIASVIMLFVSAPSVLALPDKSVKTSLDTLITPFAVLFAVGVNVAV